MWAVTALSSLNGRLLPSFQQITIFLNGPFLLSFPSFFSTLNSIFLCSVSYPYNTSKEYMITKSIQLKPWSKSVSDQLSGSKYDVTSTLIKNVQPMSRTDVLAWDRSLAQLAIRAFLNNRQCDQIGRFF